MAAEAERKLRRENGTNVHLRRFDASGPTDACQYDTKSMPQPALRTILTLLDATETRRTFLQSTTIYSVMRRCGPSCQAAIEPRCRTLGCFPRQPRYFRCSLPLLPARSMQTFLCPSRNVQAFAFGGSPYVRTRFSFRGFSGGQVGETIDGVPLNGLCNGRCYQLRIANANVPCFGRVRGRELSWGPFHEAA